MKKTTEELLNILDKSKNFDIFLKDNSTEFIEEELSVYLEKLLREKQLKKADVIKKSGINTVYAYQIFSGIKQPSRDRLIQLAFGMALSVEEAQRLLKIGGAGVLYPRIRRDSVIIYCLKNKYNIFDCDELLYDLGEEPLQTNTK